MQAKEEKQMRNWMIFQRQTQKKKQRIGESKKENRSLLSYKKTQISLDFPTL